MQIRRTACNKTEAEDKFRNILKTYAERHRRGMQWPKWYREASTENNGNSQQFPSEQPHPSTNDYNTDWNHEIDPIGPVGLLIESIVWHDTKIDDDLQIWQKNEEPLSIMKAPYQNVQPLILKLAGRSRNRGEWSRGASCKRSRVPLEIDNDVSRSAQRFDDETKGILRTVQMGGNHALNDIADYNQDVSRLCSYCGEELSAIGHIKWECKHFDPVRKEVDVELASIAHEHLPDSIKRNCSSYES